MASKFCSTRNYHKRIPIRNQYLLSRSYQTNGFEILKYSQHFMLWGPRFNTSAISVQISTGNASNSVTIMGEKVAPFAKRGRRAYGASSLKGCTRGPDALRHRPPLVYAQQLDAIEGVSCRRFVVTKPSVWFYRITTRRLGTKRHHAWARRGWEKDRYASPRMERR